MPCPVAITGVTFDVPTRLAGPAAKIFRDRQATAAPHLFSSSELETEQLLKDCEGLLMPWHTRQARLMIDARAEITATKEPTIRTVFHHK